MPQNINLLQPTGFKVQMQKEHFKNISFNAASVSHPTMSINYALQPFRKVNIGIAGDKIEFGEVTMDVLMDEEMEAYLEIYDWMNRLINKPLDNKVENDIPSSADAIVKVLNSKNNVSKTIRYIDCIPISLGNVEFDTRSGDEYIRFPVTFKFTRFEIS